MGSRQLLSPGPRHTRTHRLSPRAPARRRPVRTSSSIAWLTPSWPRRNWRDRCAAATETSDVSCTLLCYKINCQWRLSATAALHLLPLPWPLLCAATLTLAISTHGITRIGCGCTAAVTRRSAGRRFCRCSFGFLPVGDGDHHGRMYGCAMLPACKRSPHGWTSHVLMLLLPLTHTHTHLHTSFSRGSGAI